DVKSLTSKVSWQEIQQTEWFKDFYANETDSFARKTLDNPANTGVDLQGDLAFFMKQRGQGGYLVVEGGLKDASAFEKFATEVNKGGKVVKNGDVSVLNTGLKSLVSWTGNRFVYIADMPMPTAAARMSSGSDENYEPFAFKTDSLQKFAVELFDLPANNNLANDDRFASLLKETGDIHYWVNAEQYGNSLGGLLSMVKLSVLFEGNAYGTTVNFDNGKISLKSKAWYNKELTALMKKYGGGKVSEATINRIPSKNVVAAFAFKYQPEGFRDLIKLLGVDGFVNSALSSVGYSTDEFVKATKGDVLIAVSDLEVKSRQLNLQGPDGETMEVPQDMPAVPDPTAKVLFATSVNDKPSFDKLFGIIQSKSQEFGAFTKDIHFQLNNDWFAAGNSPDQVNAFLSGGNSNLDFAKRISGRSFGGYINVQQILTSTNALAKDSSAKAALDASVNMWQDVYMFSSGEASGAYTGEAEINLVDKSTNSLKQLNKYIDTISKLKDGKRSPSDAQVKISDPATMSMAALEPALH
ncbi:MAG TPA: DUF4836 family protein, partial [Niastella sp.]|nr:DUF4836 family protein [Niastella sp.]